MKKQRATKQSINNNKKRNKIQNDIKIHKNENHFAPRRTQN